MIKPRMTKLDVENIAIADRIELVRFEHPRHPGWMVKVSKGERSSFCRAVYESPDQVLRAIRRIRRDLTPTLFENADLRVFADDELRQASKRSA